MNKPGSSQKVENLPQTVEKAFNILEAFVDLPGSLGITELSHKVRLNKSTVYRILQTLKKRGYIRQDPQTNKYRLGYQILRVAGGLLAKIRLREIARDHLEELVKETAQTAQLAVWDQNEAVFIDQAEGSDIIRLRLQIGTRTPLPCTAAGKSILAFLDGEDLEKSLGGKELEALTPRTITSLAKLKRQLQTVKRKGFSFAHGEYHKDISAVGAPIFGIDGKVIAAVVLTMPSFRFKRKEMAYYGKLVKNAAVEISKKVGSQTLGLMNGTPWKVVP